MMSRYAATPRRKQSIRVNTVHLTRFVAFCMGQGQEATGGAYGCGTQHRRSGTRFHAWGASRCFATQTMVARNPPGVGYRGTFGRLFQQIRLSFQPPPLPPPRLALSPTTATCCGYPTHSVYAVAFSRSDVKPVPVVVTVLR